ncbi:hypothetical protein [Niastella populi]|uniref:DegT/DnrJ/EryC1/StrS aminotransferase n=1 Tax=Niastella populi TaxID=550983 RepID=A0A1V9GAM6_9BACT|nr:hypothetical protein [Niastella populi]OQP67508.1 hypothetical protein A4R26_12540 [Niastella populi]
MKPVGGYFELELSKGRYAYHETPYTFKSGRSALHYILRVCKPALVYVPVYTCNALLQSFEAAGITYKRYAIDEKLDPVSLPALHSGEYFLYINYFGLKDATVEMLSARYGEQLIADCTQAFFVKGNGCSWFFNSCRKFFGVPDGAYLYPPGHLRPDVVEGRNETYTVAHLMQRFNGHVQEGYKAFTENEQLCGAEITGMSVLSEYLLSNTDHAGVINRRRANFSYLHQVFRDINRFSITAYEEGVPMVYPLMTGMPVDREKLYRNRIFVPTFWEEVKQADSRKFSTEIKLANNLLPLPIDHRYSEDDMQKMAEVIQLTI